MGCAKKSASQPARFTGQPAAIAGRYAGWSENSTRTASTTFTATFGQSGSSIFGSASIAGSPCFRSVVLGGYFTGHTTFWLETEPEGDGGRIILAGKIAGRSIGGTYKVEGGACGGEEGTWSAGQQ